MFGIFKKDPVKKLRKQYERKLTEAMQAQRSGDIKRYSELTAESETLLAKLEALEAA